MHVAYYSLYILPGARVSFTSRVERPNKTEAVAAIVARNNARGPKPQHNKADVPVDIRSWPQTLRTIYIYDIYILKYIYILEVYIVYEVIIYVCSLPA